MQILASLHPWIANVELDKTWPGTPTEALLSALYALTERHGTLHSNETKELWRMAVDKQQNVSAVLDYVLHRVVDAHAGGPAQVCSCSLLKSFAETRIHLLMTWCTCLSTCFDTLDVTSGLHNATGSKREKHASVVCVTAVGRHA